MGRQEERLGDPVTTPLPCTCGVLSGQAPSVPSPHQAWRHLGFCPHASRIEGIPSAMYVCRMCGRTQPGASTDGICPAPECQGKKALSQPPEPVTGPRRTLGDAARWQARGEERAAIIAWMTKLTPERRSELGLSENAILWLADELEDLRHLEP
jgi:hypothetical protein